MSLEYIRRTYGVPAKKGMRVIYKAYHGVPVYGTIVGSRGPYLRIRLDGEKLIRSYHPTWDIKYIQE